MFNEILRNKVKEKSIPIQSTYSSLIELMETVDDFNVQLFMNNLTPNVIPSFSGILTQLKPSYSFAYIEMLGYGESSSTTAEMLDAFLSLLVLEFNIDIYSNLEDNKNKIIAESDGRMFKKQNLASSIIDATRLIVEFFHTHKETFNDIVSIEILDEFEEVYEDFIDLYNSRPILYTINDIMKFDFMASFKDTIEYEQLMNESEYEEENNVLSGYNIQTDFGGVPNGN